MHERIPWLEDAAREGPWLVAVSGGADSLALLHFLAGAGFEGLVVCHLNHQLRGAESAADARFVAELASRLGLDCEMGEVDVPAAMRESGDSMETAARKARLVFFARCAVKRGCERVILAHHADDQAETVLWNLLRGSHGVRGMRVRQRIEVDAGDGQRVCLDMHRPLLEVRHSELVAWLLERGLTWREDASNLEPVAVRNRLRHEAMPLLADITGRDPAAALARAAADAADLADWIDQLLDQAEILDPQGRLHLRALGALHPILRRAALKRYLAGHRVPDITRALIDRATALLDPGNPAVVNLPGGRLLRRRAARIWIDG
jgi:tRNA(Ile)-lysidine synthase